MATQFDQSGGILSRFMSGGGILSSSPVSGILSERLTALNTRITSVKAAPDIPGKVQALLAPPKILGGSLAKSLGVNKNLANKEVFTQQNVNPYLPPIPSVPTVQPAVRGIPSTTTFILK